MSTEQPYRQTDSATVSVEDASREVEAEHDLESDVRVGPNVPRMQPRRDYRADAKNPPAIPKAGAPWRNLRG